MTRITQNPFEFGLVMAHAEVAWALGISPAEMDTSLRSHAALRSLVPDMDAIRVFLLAECSARNLFVVCLEPCKSRQRAAAWMFAPDLGVPEHPATGSTNGTVAGYALEDANPR